MTRWPSKRMVKRMARKDMPDYQPRDNAAVEGEKWGDDTGCHVEHINERDYGIASVDEVLDDLQR